jgi:hypothetical protein
MRKKCECGGNLKQIACIDPDYREYICSDCSQQYGQKRFLFVGRPIHR